MTVRYRICTEIEGCRVSKKSIFFNDQFFNAYVFSSDLIKSAKRSVVLIDNYIDEVTLLQLSKREEGVDGTFHPETVNSTL
jgi:hypothetical protein